MACSPKRPKLRGAHAPRVLRSAPSPTSSSKHFSEALKSTRGARVLPCNYRLHFAVPRFSRVRGLSPAFYNRMETQQGTAAVAVATHPDITFTCSHCQSALVVAVAAAGMTLDCRRCGKPTVVPKLEGPAAPSADAQSKLADVQRRMKENESQRTEITSYINQLSIQLHRWQLRLQTLNERKKELDEEARKTS
jgi:transcription elongation factor Elf1